MSGEAKTSLMAKKQAQWAEERRSQKENDGLGMDAGREFGGQPRQPSRDPLSPQNTFSPGGAPGSLVERKRMQWMQEQQEMQGGGSARTGGNALLSLGNGDPKIQQSQQKVQMMEYANRGAQGEDGYDPMPTDPRMQDPRMQDPRMMADEPPMYAESQYSQDASQYAQEQYAQDPSQYTQPPSGMGEAAQQPSTFAAAPGSKAEQKRRQWEAEREAASQYDRSMFGHMGAGDPKIHATAEKRAQVEQALSMPPAPSAASPARGSLMERKQAQWAAERAASNSGYRG